MEATPKRPTPADPNVGDVVQHGRFSYVYLGRVDTSEERWHVSSRRYGYGYYETVEVKNKQAWHGLGLTATIADYASRWAFLMGTSSYNWHCNGFSLKERKKVLVVDHVVVPSDYWARLQSLKFSGTSSSEQRALNARPRG